MKRKKSEYKQIKKTPKKYILIMVITFFSINMLSLALPLAMKKIYSSVLVSKSVETLTFVLAFASVALTLEIIMRAVKDSSSKWISAKYEHKLTVFLLEKILHGKESDYLKDNYIANLEKFKSLTTITGFYSSAYYQLWIDIPFIALFLYLVYAFGGVLVLIPIILSGLYILFMFIHSIFYFNNKKKFIQHNEILLNNLIEALDKIHFIKASGIEENQINQFKIFLSDSVDSEYNSNQAQILPTLLSSNLSQLSFFLILLFGGYFITQEVLTFGLVTACAMLAGRAISPVVSIMKFYQQTQDVKLLELRIDHLVNRLEHHTIQTPDFPEDIYGTIECIDMQCKNTHSGELEVINQKIKKGDFFVIDPLITPEYMTIMNKISGREVEEKGKILLDNLDISKWNINSLRGKVEFIDEKVVLFKGSVFDNITMFSDIDIQLALEAAALTGLDELVSQMPMGFETELDSFMTNYLTSAFLQRLNLTRSLLEKPRVLIINRIDEGMDNETLQIYIWLLEKFKNDTTLLVITRNQEIKKMATTLWDPIYRKYAEVI